MPSIVNDVSARFVAMTTWNARNRFMSIILKWENHTAKCNRTFLEPGGAGSKIRVCISLGSAEYTGRMIRSGISGPRDFIRSYNISQAVSISSWPMTWKKTNLIRIYVIEITP